MKFNHNIFITLMAFLMSLTALAIDAMLPALNQIQLALNIQDPNNVQLVISSVFFGMSFGLMLFGPLSDAYGRKNPLYVGLVIFILGSVLSLLSTGLEAMLLGRFFQGFGASSARVITVSMIRDCFKGDEMGKIMSLIMTIFVIVPAIAPSLGQVILYISTWQSIFGLLILFGIVGLVALKFNQEETLAVEDRIPFSLKNLTAGIMETLKNPIARGYTLASGFVFGAFVTYLSLSQPILQVQYDLGEKFSFYFGGLVIFIGLSSFINAKLVLKYGMVLLTKFSLLALSIVSGLFLIILLMFDGIVSLPLFLTFLGMSFIFIGVLFGNLNSLAVEPLGHIAGIANSVISAVQTLISVLIAAIVGQMYTGNLYPLVIAFFGLSLLSLITVRTAR